MEGSKMRVIAALLVLFVITGVQGSNRLARLRRLSPEQQRTPLVKPRHDERPDCTIYSPKDLIEAERWLEETSETESETESDTDSDADFILERSHRDHEWDIGFSEKSHSTSGISSGPGTLGETKAASSGPAEDSYMEIDDTSQQRIPPSVLGKRASVKEDKSILKKRRKINDDSISQHKAGGSSDEEDTSDHQLEPSADPTDPSTAFGAKETVRETDCLDQNYEVSDFEEDTSSFVHTLEELIEIGDAKTLDAQLTTRETRLCPRLLRALRDQALRASQETGQHEVLKILFKYGAAGSGRLSNGMPIVHYAVSTGDTNLLRVVLEAGAPTNVLYGCRSLLQHSMVTKVPGMRDILKEFGAKEIYLAADLDSQNQYIAESAYGEADLRTLQDAIENDDVQQVTRLLEIIGPSLRRPAMMRLRDQVLRRAKLTKKHRVAKVFFEHGASGAGRMPNGSKYPIVYYAALTGKADFLQAVLEAGANPNVRFDRKPLLECMKNADRKIIELLKRYGAKA